MSAYVDVQMKSLPPLHLFPFIAYVFFASSTYFVSSMLFHMFFTLYFPYKINYCNTKCVFNQNRGNRDECLPQSLRSLSFLASYSHKRHIFRQLRARWVRCCLRIWGRSWGSCRKNNNLPVINLPGRSSERDFAYPPKCCPWLLEIVGISSLPHIFLEI